MRSESNFYVAVEIKISGHKFPMENVYVTSGEILDSSLCNYFHPASDHLSSQPLLWCTALNRIRFSQNFHLKLFK